MSEKRCSLSQTRTKSSRLATPTSPAGFPETLRPRDGDMSSIGPQQCFISAMRTSMIGSGGTLSILRSMQNSPINIHLGVHAFAAGVVLGLLALQNPVAPVGQDCKRGIARLMQAPKAAGLDAHVWSQAADVLTDLMRVVATEEVNALLRERNDTTVRDHTFHISSFGEPTEWYSDTTRSISEVSAHTVTTVPGATGQTPLSETLIDTSPSSKTSNGGNDNSYREAPIYGSGGVTANATDMQPDLSPFSEFMTENYTLYNYRQAWMIDDISHFSI